METATGPVRPKLDVKSKKQLPVISQSSASSAGLVELGCLSNRNEARFLASEEGQDLLASGLYRAIRDYKERYEAGLGLDPTAPDHVAARD